MIMLFNILDILKQRRRRNQSGCPLKHGAQVTFAKIKGLHRDVSATPAYKSSFRSEGFIPRMLQVLLASVDNQTGASLVTFEKIKGIARVCHSCLKKLFSQGGIRSTNLPDPFARCSQ